MRILWRWSPRRSPQSGGCAHSKDLADHKADVERLARKVDAAYLTLPERKDVEANAHLRERFGRAWDAAKTAVDAYNTELAALRTTLTPNSLRRSSP